MKVRFSPSNNHWTLNTEQYRKLFSFHSVKDTHGDNFWTYTEQPDFGILSHKLRRKVKNHCRLDLGVLCTRPKWQEALPGHKASASPQLRRAEEQSRLLCKTSPLYHLAKLRRVWAQYLKWNDTILFGFCIFLLQL